MGERSPWDRGKGPVRLGKGVPPFVGRRPQLEWLEYGLQEVLAGRPRVVLLAGEAGMGKTRLLREMQSLALHRGMHVCWGHCAEELALPYSPFVEALHSAIEQLPAEEGEHLLGTEGALIRQILSRASIPPPAGPSLSSQPDQDKLQLLLAVSRAIIRLAQQCPRLFILDNLHWADRPSLHLFEHLVFALADTVMQESVPLYVIGSYRPLESAGPLRQTLAKLQREEICQTLVLPGLSEGEIREFVQVMGIPRPSQQLVATLSEATQGNPLCMQEGLYHLVQQDALQERGGYIVTTADPFELRLPEQVSGVIAHRVQELSAQCHTVLTLASFFGDRFSLQALSVVSGLSVEEVLVLLEEGMQQRLLLSEGQMFRFTHALYRYVFYHKPSVARRQRIHQQIAQTLEHLYAESLDAHLLEIAHHLVRAGPAADSEKVVTYARRAGDQAVAMFAWGEAARYYETALTAAESANLFSIQERAELHYRAGLAYYRDMDVGPCLDHYDKAIEAYQLTGDECGLAQVLIEKTRTQYTLASVPLGNLIDIQPLERVLAILGDKEPGLRGHILVIIADVYRNARQTEKAILIAQQALVIGQHLKDASLCARASFVLALAQHQSLHIREALESWQNTLVYARQTDDIWLQGWPVQRRALASVLLGDLDEAEVAALEACALNLKTHDWADYSMGLSTLASVAVARGHFTAVEQRAHETMLMVYRSRYPWGGARSLLALACSRALRGAWTEAEDALNILVEPGQVFENAGRVIQSFAWVFRQLIRAYAESPERKAEEEIKQYMTHLLRPGGPDTYALASCCALVELSDRIVAPTIAEQLYQILSQVVERGVLFSHGWVFSLPRILGVAALLHQRWDKAEEHFQMAIKVATNARAQPERGRSCLDYIRLLVARGRKKDHRQAIELISQAHSIFHELGMEPFAQRARQLAETLQISIPIPSLPPSAYPASLNEQEVAILVSLAQGYMEQEIANNLMLSSQTVNHYMNSLFNKIGVTSRTAAVDYALERGLFSPILLQHRLGRPAKLVPYSQEGQVSPPVVSPPRERALVVILVTDMQDSTAVIQHFGDAKAQELLRIHNTIIRACLHEYGGSEITHTGDGIEASFPSASLAVECAVAIQRAFAKHNQEHPDTPLRVRIGLNAGEPIPMEGRLFGIAIHVTFRICACAQPGQILVSDVIRQLTAGKGFSFISCGDVALKGFSEHFRLYEVPWKNT